MASSIRLFVRQPPYSTDPFVSDVRAHGIAFSSLSRNITSRFHQDGVTPELASSWKANAERTRYEFTIRNDLRFSNGDLITPQIIAQSLSRMAYLIERAGSQSDLTSKLFRPNGAQITPLSHPGISVTDHLLILTFNLPNFQVPDLLSKSLFAIVHPNDFDSITGKWLDDKKITSSGPYEISSWSPEDLHLKMRVESSLPAPDKRSIHEVVIHWNTEKMLESDVIFQTSSLDLENWSFQGGIANGIGYTRCLAWNDPDSPFRKRQYRVAFRETYYKVLESQGFSIVRSFLPLALGMVPFQSPNSSTQAEPTLARINIGDPGNMSPIGKATTAAAYQVAKQLSANSRIVHLNGKDFFMEYGEDIVHRKSDITTSSTNVHIEDPAHDVRFMFQSKEGIRLPDEDGSILPLLEHANENLGLINRKIWEQAIIWPIGHISFGFWSRGRVDFSHVNLFTSGTYFSTWRLL